MTYDYTLRLCNFVSNRSRFTGKERDSESGNDYFGARYYASSMGRFLSPDPAGVGYADPTNPQSLNLYSYVYNNPLINIDPSGLDACAYDWGDGTATIMNAADGGAVDCPGNGFYITTPQQVNAVGFNQNGDLSVYGAGENLYNPDGSAYDPTQSITVNGDDGSSSYTGPEPIYSPVPNVATIAPQNVDPNQQNIQAFVQGVARDTASMPWLCNTSLSLQAQILMTPLSVGVTADRHGLSPSAKASYVQKNGGVALTTNGKNAGYQIVAPVTPFVNATLSTAQNQASVGASKRYQFGPGYVSASASLTFGYLGDPNCR